MANSQTCLIKEFSTENLGHIRDAYSYRSLKLLNICTRHLKFDKDIKYANMHCFIMRNVSHHHTYVIMVVHPHSITRKEQHINK